MNIQFLGIALIYQLIQPVYPAIYPTHSEKIIRYVPEGNTGYFLPKNENGIKWRYGAVYIKPNTENITIVTTKFIKGRAIYGLITGNKFSRVGIFTPLSVGDSISFDGIIYKVEKNFWYGSQLPSSPEPTIIEDEWPNIYDNQYWKDYFKRKEME